jgi:hypothetical protein
LKREFQREQKEWDRGVREGRVKVDEEMDENGDVKEESFAVKDEEEEVKVKEESDEG